MLDFILADFQDAIVGVGEASALAQSLPERESPIYPKTFSKSFPMENRTSIVLGGVMRSGLL